MREGKRKALHRMRRSTLRVTTQPGCCSIGDAFTAQVLVEKALCLPSHDYEVSYNATSRTQWPVGSSVLMTDVSVHSRPSFSK